MRKAGIFLLSGFLGLAPGCRQEKAGAEKTAPLYRRDHGLSLPLTGPYSKRHLGIAMMVDTLKGATVEFPLSVTHAGGKKISWTPEKENSRDWTLLRADENLRAFIQRYYLLGTEGLYCDAEYAVLDGGRFTCALRFVNHTLAPQRIFAEQALLHEWETPEISLEIPSGAITVEAEAYTALHAHHRYGADGELECVRRMVFASGGKALEGHFGEWPEDSVSYVFESPTPMKNAVLHLRFCKVYDNTQAFAFYFDGRRSVIGFSKTSGRYASFTGWKYLSLPLGTIAAGEHVIALRVLEPQNLPGEKQYERNLYTFPVNKDLDRRTEFAIDFFCLTEAGANPGRFVKRVPETQNALSFTTEGGHAAVHDKRLAANGWFAFGAADSGLRFEPFLNRYFLREVTEHAYHEPMPVDSATPEADIVTVPGIKLSLPEIEVAPQSERVVYLAGVRAGDSAAAVNAWQGLMANPAAFRAPVEEGIKLYDSAFAPSINHLLAYVWGNESYPNEILGKKVLGTCPSKFKFNMLYTWDAGLTAVAQAEFSPGRAVENILQYFAENDSRRGFIEHGTGLPTQIYALWELFQRTGDVNILRDLYPAARNAYRFYAGAHPASTSLRNGNGLINTSVVWYNAIGMDDYPVQKYCAENNLLSETGQSETNASAIRFAKIMRLSAQALGLDKEFVEYDRDIQNFSTALDTLWDPATGYYCWTFRGKKLLYQDSLNFNMGLSGVYPLAAGLSDTLREQRLVGHLKNPEEMWTSVGISTVDRSAPYYSPDGYWNGRVWIAHQWVLWKALLDCGETDFAEKVARTAVDVYSKAERETGQCWENFIISKGEGSGTPHFSALSAPVVNFYCAYFRPGRVSTGFDTYVAKRRDDGKGFPTDLTLVSPFRGGKTSVVMVLEPGTPYEIDGKAYQSTASGSVSVALYIEKSKIIHIRKAEKKS